MIQTLTNEHSHFAPHMYIYYCIF